MVQDLTELRGEGWKRLLTAARRSLERTGGTLDRSIGLSSPSNSPRWMPPCVNGTVPACTTP